MQIQKINFLPQTNCKTAKTKQTEQRNIQNNSYNPIAYQDYNITFGMRHDKDGKPYIFRTPANFYQQPFNKNGMPKTMQDYLFDDYEDRQNMAPLQMMKLVYDDINDIDSLENIKRHFKDEPLFENLHDEPSIKARDGILAEIREMNKNRPEGKTLFKNGKDNLGVYILKKIYLEGKTMKEINEDLQKDISVYYKGLSPIDYSTLKAFGIKYPNNAFWRSFLATRDNYNCDYKPRKPIVKTQNNSPITRRTKTQKENIEENFGKVDERDLDEVTRIFVKSNGDKTGAEKQIRRKKISNKKVENFVCRYMGEISSIVLDRMGASEEMIRFYENYDNTTKSAKKRMDDYWFAHPEMKELQSILFKDTLKLFMNDYGLDGNNDNFRGLLEYAHSLKPAREERKRLHDEKQTYYNEIFSENIGTNQVENVALEELPSLMEMSDEELDKMLAISAEKNNNETIVLEGKDRPVIIVFDVNKEFNKKLRKELELTPSVYAKKYFEFLTNHPTVTKEYKLAVLLKNEYKKLNLKKPIMTEKEILTISEKINSEFTDKFPKHNMAAKLTMINFLRGITDIPTKTLIELAPADISSVISEILGSDEFEPEIKNELNKEYKKYLNFDLNNKEKIKLTNLIVEKMSKASTKFITDKAFASIVESMRTTKTQKVLREILMNTDVLKEFGGAVKYLTEENQEKDITDFILLMILNQMSVTYPKGLVKIIGSNENSLEIIKSINPNLYYRAITTK